MKKRILSGIVLVIITASSLLAGSWFLFGICLAISLIGMFELYRIFDIHDKTIGIVGYISAIIFYIIVYFDYKQFELLIILASLILTMTVYVIKFPEYNLQKALVVFFGLCYIAAMISYIYQTRTMENGLYIVWLIFICSWGNDTFAYFTGVLLGKHKMSPKLSPNKSIEGAVGGILGAALLGAVYGFLIADRLVMVSMFGAVFGFTVASAVGAFLSIIGDLAASAIKRDHQIKDYGKLIPGHGGIMDRYDSVIFTAPVVYWVIYFLSGRS